LKKKKRSFCATVYNTFSLSLSLSLSLCVCVCVCLSVALVTQHAKCMCRIVLSPVACPAVPYFLISSHKQNDFQIAHKTRFSISQQLSSQTFLILKTTERYTGLFKMIVGVLTTCHTQYTSFSRCNRM